MIDGKRVIGIVPARGGSKGLPLKNIRELFGKPLIGWTIDGAKKSRYLDELMVTTDSDEIARIARSFGVAVPFLRPSHLASDHATTCDALQHAVEFYSMQLKREFDYLVLLEPTSPLREVGDIDKALELIVKEPSAEALVSMCLCEGTHPCFMAYRSETGFLKPFASEGIQNLRRQDVTPIYFPEGTIYIARPESYFKRKTFYHERTLIYPVERWKSIEIDDIYDFVMAEAILKYRAELLHGSPNE